MWFPTHIRQGRAQGLLQLFVILFSSLLLTGCTSMPKFVSAQHVAGPIPVPVFDELDTEVAAKPQSRIASSRPMMGLVSEPEPFAWQPLATSAGKRDIQGITVGRGGYRTVVLGSLAGDDPLAIAFTEQLAKHIHQNQIILGGIQATVICNPNPDAAARFRTENENGVYLNRQFVTGLDSAKELLHQEPEVRFLVGMLEEGQPQRVIHVRSIAGDSGVVAASSGAASVAKDVAEWLGFRTVNLPGRSAEGTLERFLSEKETCEVITFAIPQSADKAALWETYGDAVLNLLLDEDYETRKLARQQRGTTAADSRGKKDRRGK